MASEVLQTYPRIDVLVNNVGGVLEHPARHR
jgi:NAD(P)-dependent dehydrogenase (short-subunit alcohol dehydrogenase family)